MQLRRKIKRLAALVLAMSMALGCMPVGAWAEATTPTDLPPIIATDGEAVPEPTLPSDEQEAEKTDDEPDPEDAKVPDESDSDNDPAGDDSASADLHGISGGRILQSVPVFPVLRRGV